MKRLVGVDGADTGCFAAGVGRGRRDGREAGVKEDTRRGEGRARTEAGMLATKAVRRIMPGGGVAEARAASRRYL